MLAVGWLRYGAPGREVRLGSVLQQHDRQRSGDATQETLHFASTLRIDTSY